MVNPFFKNNGPLKIFDILKLSSILKEFNFQNLLIFYPSLRIYFAAKIAGIKKIYSYNFFKTSKSFYC